MGTSTRPLSSHYFSCNGKDGGAFAFLRSFGLYPFSGPKRACAAQGKADQANINNVKTLASIPVIIVKKGRKVVSSSGHGEKQRHRRLCRYRKSNASTAAWLKFPWEPASGR